MNPIKEAGGIVGCPSDAVQEIKAIADYVCMNKAGEGALREFSEWLVLPRRDETNIRKNVEKALELSLIHIWYKASGKEEVVDNIHIYPADYFCPMNYYDGKITITQNTRTIHHYAETWHNIAERKIDAIRRKFYNTRYKDSFLQSFVILPFRIWNKLLILLEKRK